MVRVLVFGLFLAIGLWAGGSPAQAASPASCAERLQAAGVDPGKLVPGQRGRLDGYEFIVATGDAAAKICARIAAEKERAESLKTQLNDTSVQLSRAQEQVVELRGGGPIKDNYLVVDGCLLGWAVIATIWASYFAGRLNPRRRHSF
ncbi:MAG: hypothetical protein JO127_09590 [Caulobacteraceae bacterium]|nr:hypothetical protein [Caulobacteraceae bacterium]